MNALAELRYCCPTCRAVFRTGMARCPLDGSRLQETADDPLLDTVVADRYVIEDLIGEGAMGRVYRVRHRRVSRKFALKVLFGDHGADPTMRKRFAREAEAASRLGHPNVASVIDFGATTEGLLYLVMDYVEGRELSDIIDQDGPMASARIASLVRQMASGLAHAHEHGLVHRDFKSSNVLVAGPPGAETAHIVDFGMAVLAEPEEKIGVRLTTDGTMVGTLAYMAPEQATGAPVDARTDLFSLGVVVYEMLAGMLPFDGAPLAMARQNLAVDPPPICERVPGLDVSAALERISNRLMAKLPDKRFQTGHEVIAALDLEKAMEPAPVMTGAIVEVADDDVPASVPVPVPDSVPVPVAVPVSVSDSVPASVSDSDPDSGPVATPAKPPRSDTMQVTVPPFPGRARAVPLTIHGRALLFAIVGALGLGFVITIVATRMSRASKPTAPIAAAPAPTRALAPAPDLTATPPPPVVVVDVPPTPTSIAPPTLAIAPAPSHPSGSGAAAAVNPGRTRPPRAAGVTTAAALSAAESPTPAADADSKDPLFAARARLAAGDTAGAIKLLGQETLVTPGRPALYETLGDAHVRTGNRIAAIGAYRRYLMLASPTDRNRARVEGKLKKLGGL